MIRHVIDVPRQSAILGRLSELWEYEDCAAIVYITPCPAFVSACMLEGDREFALLVRLGSDSEIRLAVVPRGCTLVCTAEMFRELSVICSDV